MERNYISDRYLEHPTITSMERWGVPYGSFSPLICPVCGAESDTFYVNRYGDIVGCSDCVTCREAGEIVPVYPGGRKGRWRG